jgi:chromosome segregation ATPase
MIVDQGEASVLEAYAQVEDKYYNLSADDNNIEVKESVATMLGLKSADANPDKKGGSTKVPGENLETVAIEEFNKVKESNEALTGQLTEKDAVIAEKDTKITELSTQLQEKDAAIAEKDTALTEKDTALAEKDAQIAEKDARVTELEESKGTVEAERDALLTDVANLKAASHKALAERVVELKLMLSKITSEGKAEALEAHIGRTEDSLNDSLVDLQKELEAATFARATAITTATVLNPALGAITGESASTIVGKDGKVEHEDNEEVTKEKVFVDLFSGSYSKTNNRR